MDLLTGTPRLETLRRPPRLAGLDVARGLAVVSMFFAHFGPDGGVWAISERLTAMLFAMIVGASLMLTARRLAGLGFVGFMVSAAWRCVVLVVLGVLLARLYDQIDIVLQTLGVLTLVLAPIIWLLRGRIAPTLALAAVFAIAAPMIQSALMGHLMMQPPTSHLYARAMDLLFVGVHYRVATFMVPALLGAALVTWLTTKTRSTRDLALFTCWTLVIAAAGFVIGKRFLGGAMVYSGSFGEIISGTALAAAALLGCWLAARLLAARSAVLEPLAATGKNTLSVYAVQILAAWAWVRWVTPGQRDDNPFLLLGVTLGSLLGAWLWDRYVGRGPLELLVRLPRYALKARWKRAEARLAR